MSPSTSKAETAIFFIFVSSCCWLELEGTKAKKKKKKNHEIVESFGKDNSGDSYMVCRGHADTHGLPGC